MTTSIQLFSIAMLLFIINWQIFKMRQENSNNFAALSAAINSFSCKEMMGE